LSVCWNTASSAIRHLSFVIPFEQEPMMQDFFFYLFASLTLLCGFLVVANPFSRNPVTSAMFLVLTIISLAGLFVLLEAFFLAAVQVLVYAGAVMVLFLFVIMLLDLKEEQRRKLKKTMLGLAVVSVGSLVLLFGNALRKSNLSANLAPPSLKGETIPLGKVLFTQYLLQFEIVSVLLLVAMVGVILLSKKDLK
jgi:NADH-quinone oxidoreductase subunit J